MPVGRMIEKSETSEPWPSRDFPWFHSKAGAKCRDVAWRAVKETIEAGLKSIAGSERAADVEREIAILNTAWVLFCAVNQAPDWQPHDRSKWSREDVQKHTYLAELLGVCEYWRLQKSIEEMSTCHLAFVEASKKLDSVIKINLTKEQLSRLYGAAGWPPPAAQAHQLPVTEGASIVGLSAKARLKVRRIFSFVVTGTYAREINQDQEGQPRQQDAAQEEEEELEGNHPHLRDKEAHVSDCQRDMAHLLRVEALSMRSLKAALDGRTFTINAHMNAQGQLVEKYASKYLGDWLLAREDIVSGLTNDITRSVADSVVELMEDVIKAERQHSLDILVNGVLHSLGDDVNGADGQVKRLVEVYVSLRDKRLYAAKVRMVSSLDQQQHTFR